MIITEEDYLEHFGKKGMKWGQRSAGQRVAIAGAGALAGLVGAHVTRHLSTPMHAVGAGAFATAGAQAMAEHLDRHGNKSVNDVAKPSVSRRSEKKAAKADVKWQKNIYSVHGAVAVHNRMADRMDNGPLQALNSRHTNPIKVGPNGEMDMSHPATRKYVHEYQQLVAHHTAQAIKDVHGVSPSGKHEAKLDTSDKNNWKVKVTPVSMKHGIDGMDSFKDEPKGISKAPELLMEVERTANNKIAMHKKVK